jgi:isopenicillin-N epimerase
MSHELNRRRFLAGAAGLAAGATALPGTALAAGAADSAAGLIPAAPAKPQANASNEAYWREIGKLYDVAPDYVNLENGYFGVMTRPVADEYKRNIDYLNKNNSYFMRQQFDSDGIEKIRARIAAEIGAATGEVAITRGATESLQNLITNFRLVKQGDTIMYADIDYDATQYAMHELASRRGASEAVVRMPEPATRQAVLDAYAQAMRQHPRTRLLLLTHISHRTGLKLPIAELCQMARARGIDVIVDVAQSFGQMELKVADLQADFIGFNLHKWVGAPLGTGLLYIRKERLADIGVHMGDRDYDAGDIRSRVHSGTANTANTMTVPYAFDIHHQIGAANKSARLQYLRNDWVERVRGIKNVQILTPDDPAMYGAVTSFRLTGQTSKEGNVLLARRLLAEHGVFTVARHGLIGGSCIRVTPALFTQPRELDKLVQGIRALSGAA